MSPGITDSQLHSVMRADIGNVELFSDNLETELSIKTEGRHAGVAPKKLGPLLLREIRAGQHKRPAKPGALSRGIRRHPPEL
jgi:hypothetical protein